MIDMNMVMVKHNYTLYLFIAIFPSNLLYSVFGLSLHIYLPLVLFFLLVFHMQRVLHRQQPKHQGRFKFKVRQLGTSQMAGNLKSALRTLDGWSAVVFTDSKWWEIMRGFVLIILYVYNSILYSTFAFCHQSSFIRTLSSLSICTCFGIRNSLGWLSINPEAQPELRLDDANGSCWEPWKMNGMLEFQQSWSNIWSK